MPWASAEISADKEIFTATPTKKWPNLFPSQPTHREFWVSSLASARPPGLEALDSSSTRAVGAAWRLHRSAPRPNAQGSCEPLQRPHESSGQRSHHVQPDCVYGSAEQGHVHPARSFASAQWRRRAGCVCQSFFSPPGAGSRAEHRRIFSAWVPTARWACAPSRRRRAWCWCGADVGQIIRRAARLTPGWRTSWRRWTNCRKIIAYLQRTPDRPDGRPRKKRRRAPSKGGHPSCAPAPATIFPHKRNTLQRRIERHGHSQIHKMAASCATCRRIPRSGSSSRSCSSGTNSSATRRP